jgi:hypothetical protein
MDWFRFYTSTLDNRKIQALPAQIFKVWCNFLCLSRVYEGVLPPIETVSYRLRCSQKQASDWLMKLLELRLVDELPGGTYSMHEWDQYQYPSDNAAERKRRQRQQQGKRTGRVSQGQLGHVTGQGWDMSRDKDGTCPVLEQSRADTEQNRTEARTVATEENLDFEDQVETLYRRHPKKKNKTLVPPALYAALDRASFTVIDSAHEILCRSERWTKNGGDFAPKLDEWLADDGWTAVQATTAPVAVTTRKGDGGDPYAIWEAPK